MKEIVKTKKMEKLQLTPDRQEVFQKALLAAYKIGEQNAGFLFNGMSQLVEDKDTALRKIADEHCEDVPEQKVQHPSYAREAGDGHDEFS